MKPKKTADGASRAPCAPAEEARFGRKTVFLGWVVLAVAMAATLLAMGRPPICTCGMVKLWEGAVDSAGNSQHLADWYSFSHVIHGFLFYALTWFGLRRAMAPGGRLLVAAALEAGWEVLENSPLIIDRYRTATIALGYTGDSVLNSLSDLTMMTLGFLVARRLPVAATLCLAVAFELFTLAMIRDNLTLNVLMLLWPVDAVRDWQAAL